MNLTEAVHQRYGAAINYRPRATDQHLYPNPKPLYRGMPDMNFVAEHGAWCISKCVYPQNENKIWEIINRV